MEKSTPHDRIGHDLGKPISFGRQWLRLYLTTKRAFRSARRRSDLVAPIASPSPRGSGAKSKSQPIVRVVAVIGIEPHDRLDGAQVIAKPAPAHCGPSDREPHATAPHVRRQFPLP